MPMEESWYGPEQPGRDYELRRAEAEASEGCAAEMPQPWYFTFGLGQGPLAKKYVRLVGTHGETRRRMIDTFGSKWAFQYDEEIFEGQPEEYGLSILKECSDG
jgi:hypothetical protein